MGIRGFFQSPTRSGSPRAARHRLKLEVRSVHAAAADVAVTIHNISETGLLIECASHLAIDDRIDIELPHAGSVAATVVWASGSMFGCQFDTPISPAALSAAQLRGEAANSAPSQPDLDAGDDVGDDPSVFAINLKRLRMAKGLSQASIAEQLGVSGPSVSGWEKGRVRPKEDRLADLANLLGVPVSELLVDPQPRIMHDLIAQSREQIARATGLAPEKVRIILEC